MPSVVILGTRGYPSYYGGFETAVRKIAPYLAEHGWEVTVYGREGTTEPDDPQRDPRITCITTRGLESKSFSTLSHGFTASLDTMKRKPDVALIMNVANGFFLPMLRARGIPTLVNVDGIEWDREKWGKAAKVMFVTGARLTARWATEIIVDAEEIGRRWLSEFGRDGLFIPYGGDVVRELPVQPGLTHRGYALVVARFVPENTIPEFFQAVERIADRQPVVIVGSSGYGGEFDEIAHDLAERHGNVHAYGHISDDDLLQSLWQHAGAYFHGHSVGGTNPALVQAMAAGAPTVARDTPYNREVLQHHGVFVEADPEQIAVAIDTLLLDRSEQDRLSAGARARAGTAYTWDDVCADYERALRGLIASPARARGWHGDDGQPTAGLARL
ncbi:glycosyltransferase [Agromyces sp. Marseille-P2726]|uniref:glycosyltransferase n=1 Tax=Agromyces sp. Marseille-P2726 TaxID=2709132 RepID=UPI00156D626F|nr:glycosyltransferase [Agromyces sp. Marseille-P2726]